MSAATSSEDDEAWARTLAAAYRADARYLWGLCYRMVGSAAGADDLVHECFVRALQRRPEGRDGGLRPWLTRAAMNLAIDALRRRKRAPYEGPWLPEVIDTGGEDAAAAIERREGLTIGFLTLLEALSPQQRAVVVLREIYEMSVEETAAILGTSAGSVKVAHHRARARLGERHAEAPTPAAGERHAAALFALFEAIGSGEPARVAAALTEDAATFSDGGGLVRAARRVVQGADDVARLLCGLAKKGGAPQGIGLREVNLLPSLEITRVPADSRDAGRMIVQVGMGEDGRVSAIYFVMAPAKLGGIDRRGPAPPRGAVAAMLARAG